MQRAIPKHHPRFLLTGLAVILFGILALLILHTSNNGSEIHLGSGLSFKAKDLALALILLAMLITPFLIAFYLDTVFLWRTRRLAPVVSFCVLLLFPFTFKFHLWQPANHPDGRPIHDFSGERAKSVYATLGYKPLWKAKFTVEPDHEHYETNFRGIRIVSRGHFLGGQQLTYGLNRKGWLDVEDTEPDKVHECVFVRTTHVLGLYLIDRRGSELEYMPESALPDDQCRRIDRPIIGSEIP